VKDERNNKILDDIEVMTQHDKEQEVTQLISDIEKKIERFISLTNQHGKKVKKRWRDIKKSRLVSL
jgi:hypothetical protein